MSSENSDLTRRELLAAFTALGVGALVPLSEAQASEATVALHVARASATETGSVFALKVYTPHELATVRMLVDYIFPKDARGGPASAAGSAEWMDIMLDIDPTMQQGHRGGLAWLDHECGKRFSGKAFINCTDTERRQVLDDIAWPRKAKPEFAVATAWFSSFRDFTATAYWSSEMGIKDLGYIGNTSNPDWNGCPPENYTRLGVVKP